MIERVTAVVPMRDRTFVFTASETYTIEHPRLRTRLKRWARKAFERVFAITTTEEA